MNFAPKSFHLQWHITERCNLQCRHCYREQKFLKNELSFSFVAAIFKDFLNLIRKWKLKRDDVRLTFVGGEPFVRRDFFEILLMAYKHHSKFRYGILTNGTLIDKKTAKKLKDLEIDYIQISIEGGEKINDQIRGKGTFKKIASAMCLLKEIGVAPFNTNFSMTVSRLNLKEIPKVAQLAQKLNVFLAIRRMVPIGFGRQMKKYVLAPNEVRKMWLDLIKTEKKQNFRFGFGCEDGILVQDLPNYFPKECTSGYLSMTVLPNGDVYPCRRLPILSGNLKKNSLEEIYYNSKNFKKLRNMNNLNDICHQCPKFEQCHGGARCIAHAYFGQIEAPDPHCWGLFKKLPPKNLKWLVFSHKERLNEGLINFI